MKYFIDMGIEKDHFEKTAEKVIPLYEKNEFDFLFIGPTGFYVKQVADIVAKKLKKTINRDAFRVINQYTVEQLKKYDPSAVYLERDFLKVYISKEIEELIEKEKNDTEFARYVEVLSKSSKSSEYILDIFEKKWESHFLNDRELVNSIENYRAMEEDLADSETLLYKLYSKLEVSLQEILDTKFDESVKINRNYEPISTYRWFYKELPEIMGNNKAGKILFISGFFDITPMLIKVFSAMFDMFEDVYFSLWENINDRAFETILPIYKFLEEEGFETGKKKPAKLDIKGKISYYKVSDAISEAEIVCKEIKRKILSGNNSPSDFGIVAADSNSAGLIAGIFDKIKVPYKFQEDIPLSESRLVNLCILPLKTVIRGYEVEDIISMMDVFYKKENKLSIDDIEKYFKRFNFLYDDKKMSIKKRKESWYQRIDEEISRLKDLNERDEQERAIIEINEIEILKDTLESIFELLNKIETSRKITPSWYRKVLDGWIKEGIIDLKIFTEKEFQEYDELESEKNAISSFNTLLMKIEDSLGKLLVRDKTDKIKLPKFYRILTDLSEIETYRTSEMYSNTVEIMTLMDSRLVKKEYKYFIGFNESNYPMISINPLLNFISENRNKYARISEIQSRQALIISMKFAENIILSCPDATLSGEPILISPYYKEFKDRFKIEDFNLRGTKRQVIPREPESVYSYDEALLYYVLNKMELNITDSVEAEAVKEIKKEIHELENFRENNSWILEQTKNIDYLSHNVISTYVDCPFKYYLNYRAKISGDKDFEIYSEGLIKHAVMKDLFDEIKEYSTLSHMLLNDPDGLKDKILELTYKEWDNRIKDELYRSVILKEVEAEKISEQLFETISIMITDYITISAKMKLVYDRVAKTEVVLDTKIDVGEHKDIKLSARVDRVDMLPMDYTFIMDKFEDIPAAANTFSIIDYKNNESYQSEQLFLYYLGMKNDPEWREKFNNRDVYLKFQPMNGEDKGKFLKIQKEQIVIKEAGRGKRGYTSINLEEYNEWLNKLLDKIYNSELTPLAKEDRQVKRFLKEMREKYEVSDTKEIDHNCRTFNGKDCDYAPLCSLLLYLKDFRLR